MFADYKCKECGAKYEYKKPYGTNFPEQINCKYCRTGLMDRLFSTPRVDIAPGWTGTGKTGYDNEPTYKPSPFTPNNVIEKRTSKYVRHEYKK